MLTTMLSRIAVGIARSHFFPFVSPANVPTSCPVSSRLMDAFFSAGILSGLASCTHPGPYSFQVENSQDMSGI